MTSLKLIWQASPWYLILCVLVSAMVSHLLYSPKSSWSRNINYSLATIRFVVCLILTILLLAPLLKIFKNYFEKPIIVLAIDNSQSISSPKNTAYIANTKVQLSQLASTLGKLTVDLKVASLNGSKVSSDIESLKFDQPTTNLSQLLQGIQSDFTNKNVQAIVLASDGIYNQGIDPSYSTPSVPIYTIGLGDTVPQKDIRIKSLSYNKITYIGNKFPIVAELFQYGFLGKKINITISQNKKILDSKTIQPNNAKGSYQVEFLLDAATKGLQHYQITALYQEEEFAKDNNMAHAYLEVLDNKEKILIVAASPHPDIKALCSALEKKDNYETSLYISGIGTYVDAKYDLVIFYQVPNVISFNKEILAKLIQKETPALYVVGNQSNLHDFNTINKQLSINARFGQTDNVTTAFNEQFQQFSMTDDDKKTIASYPPMMVPYGNFNMPANGNSGVILYQKIGNTISSKPLFTIANVNGKKTGAIFGEGFWQWRLYEMMETTDSKTFDKLISNMVQLVSSKDDKRKFRCYPTTNEFSTYESVFFETEIYNDLYEKTYNHKIDLKITDENNRVVPYSFVTTQQSPRFEIKGLQQGIYKYEATTLLSGKVEKSKGEFTIQAYNLEALNNTADHEMLKNLAAKSGGTYFHQTNMEQLANNLKTKDLKSLMYTTEELSDLVNLPWIFFMILAMVSLEWFVRKYKGSY